MNLENKLERKLGEIEWAEEKFKEGYEIGKCGWCGKKRPVVKVDVGGLFDAPVLSYRCFSCLIDDSVDVII